jgi:hypothetical protein
VPPTNQGFDLLTVLPMVDLSALELGMRRFLEHLERKGQPLAWPPDGTGQWPWVVAGAAAAAACEIARRQLRRPAVGRTRLPGGCPDDFVAR